MTPIPPRADYARTAPAVAGLPDGGVAVAWTDQNHHIVVALSRGGVWLRPTRLDERSWTPPALCAHGDDLVIAWTGGDDRINLLRLDSGGEPVGQRQVQDEASGHAPAICSSEKGLVLAWTGTDRRLNVRTVTDW
jgi:hypothetical protein